MASEALGRPAIPPEAKSSRKGGQAARGGQAGKRADGNRAKNHPGGPGKTGGGKSKALEAASAATKRPGRQRKPKGKA